VICRREQDVAIKKTGRIADPDGSRNTGSDAPHQPGLRPFDRANRSVQIRIGFVGRLRHSLGAIRGRKPEIGSANAQIGSGMNRDHCE